MAGSNRSLVTHSPSVCTYPSCSAENVHRFTIIKNCLCKTIIPFSAVKSYVLIAREE